MKLDRLIGILSILLQREKVTAPELAARFEVSRRTIQRDIEALCRAGIPIATTQGAGGGISILEGYRVDRTLLTAPEMQAILAGLRSLDSVSGTRRYAQLMEKLCAEAGTLVPGSADLLIDLSSWYKDSLAPKIELIQDAIRRRRTVRFCYFSPKGGIPAHGGALLSGVPLVGLVPVGPLPHPGGLPPLQAEPHDRAFRGRTLRTPLRTPAGPRAGTGVPGKVSGDCPF